MLSKKIYTRIRKATLVDIDKLCVVLNLSREGVIELVVDKVLTQARVKE